MRGLPVSTGVIFDGCCLSVLRQAVAAGPVSPMGQAAREYRVRMRAFRTQRWRGRSTGRVELISPAAPAPAERPPSGTGSLGSSGRRAGAMHTELHDTSGRMGDAELRRVDILECCGLVLFRSRFKVVRIDGQNAIVVCSKQPHHRNSFPTTISISTMGQPSLRAAVNSRSIVNRTSWRPFRRIGGE
jgi:hypothetical protein